MAFEKETLRYLINTKLVVRTLFPPPWSRQSSFSSHHPGMTPPRKPFSCTHRGILSIFPWFLPLPFHLRYEDSLSAQSSIFPFVYLPLILLPLHPTGSIPSFRPPFPPRTSFLFLRFPSHLNDRLCQSKLKPAFVYLIPRYKYRQTGYRWLLGAATSCVFEGRRWRKRDKKRSTRSGGGERRKRERKGTWKRAPFCRSRRGRRRFSVRKTV